MKRFFIFIFIITLFTSHLSAKEGYSIKVKINGVRDSMIFLANHFGDKQYIQDSCRADDQGRVKFENKTVLRGGMYLVVLPNKSMLISCKRIWLLPSNRFLRMMADTRAPNSERWKGLGR